jgi:hypothetical protein
MGKHIRGYGTKGAADSLLTGVEAHVSEEV